MIKLMNDALEKYQKIVDLTDSINGIFELLPFLTLNKGDKVAFKSNSSWWIDYNEAEEQANIGYETEWTTRRPHG